jgi:hypothetical protein
MQSLHSKSALPRASFRCLCVGVSVSVAVFRGTGKNAEPSAFGSARSGETHKFTGNDRAP